MIQETALGRVLVACNRGIDLMLLASDVLVCDRVAAAVNNHSIEKLAVIPERMGRESLREAARRQRRG